jgi:hypothetical protein
VGNPKPIPTRSAIAAQKKIGRPDLLTVTGSDVTVASAAWQTDRFRPERDEMIEDRTPGELRVEQGIAGRGEVKVRFVLRGRGSVTVKYDAEKGGTAEAIVPLQ